MRQEFFSESNPPATAQEDLSSRIVVTVSRRPGDEVRCVHVAGDKYRCNWWSLEGTGEYDNPKMRGGQLGTTYRIRKSCFMRVTRSGDKLTIVELPS
jgi:hypothetical protein